MPDFCLHPRIGAARIMAMLLLALCAACASPDGGGHASPPDSVQTEEIARLEETARSAADPSARARAYLKLARWRVSHHNPEKNYLQALKEFELSVSLTPEREIPEDVRDWIAALQEHERAAEEARKLKQRANQLQKENKELREALEKLKALDLKMEEKRRQVK